MKTKLQLVKDRTKRYRAAIQSAVGFFTDYRESDTSIWFRPCDTITLQMIQTLSDALGTERINFEFGKSGGGCGTEYTPSYGGEPGYVQVLLPIAVLAEHSNE